MPIYGWKLPTKTISCSAWDDFMVLFVRAVKSDNLAQRLPGTPLSSGNITNCFTAQFCTDLRGTSSTDGTVRTPCPYGLVARCPPKCHRCPLRNQALIGYDWSIDVNESYPVDTDSVPWGCSAVPFHCWIKIFIHTKLLNLWLTWKAQRQRLTRSTRFTWFDRDVLTTL